MGIILGALGGLGEAATNWATQAIKNDNDINLENLRAENAANKAIQLARVQEQMAVQRDKEISANKRAAAIAAGSEIAAASDQMRLGRISDLLNDGNVDSTTGQPLYNAEDVARIAASPSTLKGYGIIDRARSQELDDKVNAAEKLGYTDVAKELRGQQELERKRDYDEHKAERDERKADTADRLAAAKEEQNANWLKVMMARINNKSSGEEADTATIKTAKAIQADEKARGREISLSQAIDLTHKAADEGNNYALRYAQLQSDNGAIGPDKTDPAKPAPGKLYASVNDAMEGGRKLFVNSRSVPPTNPTQSAPVVEKSAQPAKPAAAVIPKGMTLIGKTPDGKDVYQDASGKKYTN